jgi:RNA polymerase sigma-70 factor, ECF subfamily
MDVEFETVIVRTCLSGNVNAFGSLVEKYEKPVYNLAFRMTGQRCDAEDITQSVFIKAFENLGSYDVKFRFFSWLYRIAVNETINFVKSRKRLDSIEHFSLIDENNPERVVEQQELENRVQECLLKIDEHYRIVLVLRHIQQLSYREISEALDIPEKTVKSRLFSGRNILKDLLMT